jgi:hypothetical protein
MGEVRVSRRGFTIAGLSAFLGGVVGAAIGRVALPPVEKTVTEVKTITSPVLTTQTQLQTVTVTSPVVTTQVQTVTLEKPIVVSGTQIVLENLPLIQTIPSTFRFDYKYVAERAFSAYKAICCGFGVGDALLGTLIDQLNNTPWSSLPGRGAYDPTQPLGASRYKPPLYDPDKKDYKGFTGFFRYGCGGENFWGMTCGAVLIASMIMHIMFDKATATAAANQLLWSYAEEPLPKGELVDYLVSKLNFTENSDYVRLEAPGTTMCHAVVAEITAKAFKSGITDNTKILTIRSNTCALLVADIAVRAAQIINNYLETNQIPQKYSQPAIAKTCLTCHGVNGPSPYRITFNMNSYCDTCHKQGWTHP